FDSAPPPYYDDGAAGLVGVFATNVAALASGSADTAGGTGNPTGSTGFGLAPHYTYRSKLPGDYVGGLPGPLPQELLWRDLAPKIAARDPSAVGKIWLTMLKGEKPGQLVDRQWQDAAAEYFRKNPMGSLANTGSYQP
ncbi:MAG TPA: hypothetical protein VNG33_08385, partial [Polyangiaceae bacterium]|nr:hypothetical protein [Polyangiaceae bacterium]